MTPRWLVLDKPAGWLTIPGRRGVGEGSRAPAAPVLSEWAAREHGPIWVVHRIDRETSGVVLMARTADAHREASLWFQRHEVRKAYDLLAAGRPRAPMLKLNEPIEGAPSVTQLQLKETFAKESSDACFLGRAVPLSGRRHQIRIHLAEEGHALLGDGRYGGPSEVVVAGGARLSVDRVALHAARLELPTREVFEAPWPEDFAGWVGALRGGEAKTHV